MGHKIWAPKVYQTRFQHPGFRNPQIWQYRGFNMQELGIRSLFVYLFMKANVYFLR